MNTQEKALCAKLERIMLQVQEDLGLHDWYVKLRFSRDLDGSEAGTGLEVNATSCVTKALWKYRQTVFTWYLPQAAGQSEEQLYFISLHEWVHVLMSGLFPHLKNGSHVDDINERVTEDTTRAFMVALGLDLPGATV